ncbi:MAG: DEAD/DEAH box helicase [Verrucomicrobia bacterium]|nr:DEAD/DEAH box helicase [Verrucomicrobiota bacterium]
MIPKLFSELGLSDELLKAVDKLGFEQAAPIQAAAVPVLLEGKDVVGQSQTGSGKTAAFGIPAVQLVDAHQRATQVLILCPTRELAVQVSEEIHKLTFFKRGVHALPIYGGQSYERQFFGLKQGAQIVIGTPGRVMDHMRRSTLRLDALKMVILDEADVMLNMGFRDDIELILQSVPATRQTVFFSATMPRPIRDLIEKYARSPVNISIEQKAMTVPTVEQVYYEVDRRYKIEALTRLIDVRDLKLGIIFCNTKRMVDELVDQLNAQGYSADRLHGDMSQMMRDRVMNKFRKSGLDFLVATDVAARGIDVDDIEVVFNYDVPYDVEDYVHRIGRTGRAGRSGVAITFVSGRELFQIRQIERFTNSRIQRGRVPSRNEVEEARADVFLGKIRATLASGEFRAQQPMIERLLEEGFASTDIAAALLHQLKSGETQVAAKAPPNIDRPPVERPPYREARERPPYGETRERRPYREERERPPYSEKRERPSYVEGRGRPPYDEARQRPGFRSNRDEPPRARAFEPREARPFKAPVAVARPVVPLKPAQTRVAPAPVPAKPAAVAAEPPSAAQTEISASPNSLPSPMAPFEKTAMEAPPISKRSAPLREPVARPKPLGARALRKKPWLAATNESGVAVSTELTRLHMNVGEEMGVTHEDVVNAIAGETGLPAKVVDKVDLRERHLFASVATEHVYAIISKLNRSSIKGQRLRVKVA